MRAPQLVVTLTGILALTACEESDPAPGPENESAADATGSATTTQSADDSSGGEPAQLGYWEDVKPLVDAKCGSCHVPGGIAPFSLQSYADVVEYMPVSAAAIEAGTMPPWQPGDGCNDYHGDFSLSEDEIGMLDAWVTADMPEGDPTNEGAPYQLDMPTLTRVDLELDMPEAYVPTQTPDDYRCFLIEWPEAYEDTSYVTGFRAVPGNDAIVHHVIAFLATEDQKELYRDLDAAEDGPGYTCFGGTGGPARSWVGGWAPGSEGADLPDGLGIPIEPGSMIVLQVHYNALDTNADPDVTGIELKVDDSVEKEAFVMPWANPTWVTAGTMRIPAGDPDVEHVFAFDPTSSMALGQPMTVHTAALHMHLLGKSATASVERANGDSECLLRIDDYDFSWQSSYALREPVRVENGDQLRLECHHDNSPENQPFVDGEKAEPVDVAWGEGTRDEMCLGAFLVTMD